MAPLSSSVPHSHLLAGKFSVSPSDDYDLKFINFISYLFHIYFIFISYLFHIYFIFHVSGKFYVNLNISANQ